jgi:hypothetical protein
VTDMASNICVSSCPCVSSKLMLLSNSHSSWCSAAKACELLSNDGHMHPMQWATAVQQYNASGRRLSFWSRTTPTTRWAAHGMHVYSGVHVLCLHLGEPYFTSAGALLPACKLSAMSCVFNAYKTHGETLSKQVTRENRDGMQMPQLVRPADSCLVNVAA